MKNISTKEFCRRFEACPAGTKFALKFDTMRDCYAALLAGVAGMHSAEWAIWAATREGVVPDRDLRLFAVKCARRVQHLMQDQQSVAGLDVAERYALGKATDKELAAARAAAWDAAWDAAWYAASAAAWYAASAAALAAASAAAWDAAWDAERKAQLALLAEYRNPFEVEA